MKASSIPCISFDFAYTKSVAGSEDEQVGTMIALVYVDSQTGFIGCVRLTYLFRLCFTGYFQIFVSPETFWIKLDFNLLCVFWLRVISSRKNPPIPLLTKQFILLFVFF